MGRVPLFIKHFHHMDIKVEKQDNCTARLRAVVPAETVAAERKSIAASYASQAKIPGFRPGRAPQSVVEKRFAKEIKEEITSRLYDRVSDEALGQNQDLKVLDFGNPDTLGIQDDGTFVLETTITFIPSFELPEYKGLPVSAVSTEVTDEDLEKAMDDLRQRYADYVKVDRAVAKGDVAVVDFTATVDGKPVSEVIGKPAGFLEGREGQWIRIEEDSFLPGFAMALAGVKPESQKKVTVTIPESFPLSDLHGKDVDIDVFVKETRELTLPEMNDEFAKKILPDGDLPALKERMKEVLTANKTEEAENIKIDEIATILTDAVDFPLPDALVERASQDILRNRIQASMQLLQSGGDVEAEIEKLKEGTKEEATKNLKTHFILQDIARKENIQVTDQELGQEIYRIAEQQKKQPKAVLKELRKTGQLTGIAQGLLSNKTMTFLVGEAKESAETAPVKKTAAKAKPKAKSTAKEPRESTSEEKPKAAKTTKAKSSKKDKE